MGRIEADQWDVDASASPHRVESHLASIGNDTNRIHAHHLLTLQVIADFAIGNRAEGLIVAVSADRPRAFLSGSILFAAHPDRVRVTL